MKKTTIITSLALGGFLLFAGTAAVSAVALDGEKLYQERCSQCHGLGRVDRATKELGWSQIEARNIGGAHYFYGR